MNQTVQLKINWVLLQSGDSTDSDTSDAGSRSRRLGRNRSDIASEHSPLLSSSSSNAVSGSSLSGNSHFL